ncbi:ECF transporter S component [uncultured Finegoldia sp.]|uniref:ECF transporter S component n=1 Tax=uncultured Finegoldia sp. TaxID=328009 RepID=UPI002629AB89|nr:ECF transporter S component [uncultured Finegoldia sp.]
METTRKKSSTQTMVKISILGAISALLMIFKFPLPFAPPFMTVDIGDLGVLISGFALGPIAGVLTSAVKILLNFIINGTTTGGVGELSNFLLSSVFVVVASAIYNKGKSRKSALTGLVFGVLAYTLVACISNYFVIFPLYGINLVDFTKQFAKVNPMASTPIMFVLFSIVPFNIVKGIIVSVVTICLYKPISKFLKR